MAGWLINKMQDSRIYACIKEVMWDLQTSDQVRKAKILAVASVLRHEFTSSGDIPLAIFDKPLDYSREDLMKFYGILEDIRNMNTVQLEQLKKGMQSMGTVLPEFAEKHIRLTGRALEVWMCTLGVGIATGRRDNVREIWRQLSQSKPHLDQAFAEIVQTELTNDKLTGSNTALFSTLDAREWKQWCDFSPSQFKKKLDLE